MNKITIQKLVREAIREDKARQDITSSLIIPAKQRAIGKIVAKEAGVVCGVEFAREVFRQLNRGVKVTIHKRDGLAVKKGQTIMTCTGRSRSLLAGERTALNFLGILSGIATNTKQYVNKVAGLKAKILDTRKTTPGLRALEKYAVKCGGGVNHRMNLNDAVMIKDNHVINGDLNFKTISRLKKKTRKQIIVEADTLKQVNKVLSAKPDIILLDNMNPAQLKKAVNARGKMSGKKVALEASGGITLKNARSIARTGVERISIGALTHSSKALDLSMEIKHL